MSAAIVAACGGSNHGFLSLTPLSVAQKIGVRKSSAGVIYSFKGDGGRLTTGSRAGLAPWHAAVTVVSFFDYRKLPPMERSDPSRT
jgi:hypothetical protein